MILCSQRPLRRSLTLFAFVFHALLTLASAATNGTRAFNLPAEKGDVALRRFSEQAGVEVVFGTATAAQVRTNPVSGNFAPREALTLMLDGTGLVVTPNEKTGALTVSRDP
ncbi:MAG: STN domain-containing protein, partial [Verrucomicrobiota bacterium]